MSKAADPAANLKPLVVGIGGSARATSATERALRIALRAAEQSGARTFLFAGDFLLRLPHYTPENHARNDEQRQLVEMVRQADGLIVASPGYHGDVSGLVKNALDLLEDLCEDQRCYLDGRPIGCIVTAAGWQAAVTTLVSLRSIVHALRAFPTPLGVSINTSKDIFDASGGCADAKVFTQLADLGKQVLEFASKHVG